MEDDDGLADELRDVVSSLTSSNLCPSISKELEVSLAQTFGRTGKETSSMPPPIPTVPTIRTISEKGDRPRPSDRRRRVNIITPIIISV